MGLLDFVASATGGYQTKDILERGYLEKQGNVFFHSRYFILATHLLFRFDRKPKSRNYKRYAKSTINMSVCTVSENKSEKHSFTIYDNGRPICVLRAKDHAIMTSWVKALSSVSKNPKAAAPQQVTIVQPTVVVQSPPLQSYPPSQPYPPHQPHSYPPPQPHPHPQSHPYPPPQSHPHGYPPQQYAHAQQYAPQPPAHYQSPPPSHYQPPPPSSQYHSPPPTYSPPPTHYQSPHHQHSYQPQQPPPPYNPAAV